MSAIETETPRPESAFSSIGSSFITKPVKTTEIASLPRSSLNSTLKRRKKINLEVLAKKGRFVKIDIIVSLCFGMMFLIVVMIISVLAIKSTFIENIELLEVGNDVLRSTEKGQEDFFDIAIPAKETVAIFVIQSILEENDTVLDTSLTIIRKPSTVVNFNDDNTLGNLNPILYISVPKQETLLLKVRTLEGLGTYRLRSEVISGVLLPDTPRNVFVEADEYYFTILTGLNPKETYDIMAYQNPGRLDENRTIEVEADTAIKIREIADGDEIIEAVVGSLAETTARVLFSPRTNGPYILEIKGSDGKILDIIVVARTVETIPVSLSNLDEAQVFPLHTQTSTVLEFVLEPDIQYDLQFNLDLNEDFELEFQNHFGYISYKDRYSFLDIYNSEPIPGISMRLYDKNTNQIIQRDRTDIEIVNRTEIIQDPNYAIFFYQNAEFIANENSTRLTLLSDTVKNVLLDITRWEPDYSFGDLSDIFDDFLFGSFTISINKSIPIAPNSNQGDRVDPTSLFAESGCEVDEKNFAFVNDICGQGVILYCRHNIFPSKDTSEALKSEFKDICDCTSLLCATLPLGSGLGEGFHFVLFGGYLIFALLSILGILAYVVAHLELYIFGGFKYWVQNSKELPTWTRSTLLLITASFFFTTKFKLLRQLVLIESIANSFELSSIQIPEEQLTYEYYFRAREDIVGGGYFANLNISDDNEDLFLNEEALTDANKVSELNQLLNLININLFSSVLKDALVIVVFFETAKSWLKATTLAKLNKLKQERQERQLYHILRLIEISYLVFFMLALFVFSYTNGKAYNNSPNVVGILASLIVISLFSFSRRRIAARFVDSLLDSDQKNLKLWERIRKVSSVVIISNVGIIVVQVYSIIKIKDFNDLLASSGDPQSIVMFLFQDICVFIGVAALTNYLFDQYLEYRESLFSEVLVAPSLGYTTTQSTRKARSNMPTEYVQPLQQAILENLELR